MAYIEFEHVSKIYNSCETKLYALIAMSFTVEQ